MDDRSLIAFTRQDKAKEGRGETLQKVRKNEGEETSGFLKKNLRTRGGLG